VTRRQTLVVSGQLDNVGDLALFSQSAAGLGQAGHEGEISVRQWGMPRMSVVAQLLALNAGVVDARSPRSLAIAARSNIVVGGGQMIRDNTSRKALLSLAVAATVARATGGAMIVLACGVDRLRRRRHRWLWRHILSASRLITTRDAASRDAVLELLGHHPNLHVTEDLMFLETPNHAALRRYRRTAGPVIVAPCHDQGERRAVDVVRVARSAEKLAKAFGTDSVLMVSHDSRASMDPPVCEAIGGQLAPEAGLNVSALQSGVLEEYLCAYASCSVVLTNRLHAAIFGILAKRPVLLIDDGTSKLREAAARFHIPMISVHDVVSDALVADLAAEGVNVPDNHRSDAIEAAKLRSQRNFDLLKQAVP
jgi:polysaccharide pyruvyl transferase WcaK-like protein